MIGTGRDPRDEPWRRDVNRAVREVVSGATALDDDSLAEALKGMLAALGEALALDCGAVVALSDGAVTAIHYWQRSPADGDRLAADVSFEDMPFDVAGMSFDRVGVDEPVTLHSASDHGLIETYADAVRASLRQSGLEPAVILPMGVTSPPSWAWAFGAAGDRLRIPETVVEHLRVLGDLLAGALESRQQDREEPHAHEEMPEAVERERDTGPIRRFRQPHREFEGIVGESPALRMALDRLEEVAQTESTVLLLGETGTGKELFARALHARGPRRGFPLVSVNCGALPPTLIESELFGHQRGAFTGAIALRQGRFEMAHRGSLFLDEIGDLPLELQAKLLRVLQEGMFERVGSSHSQAVDVRIIAATHRDLTRLIADGEFRSDLFYRLNVFPIRLPRLCERSEDIPALVWSIIHKRQQPIHRHIKRVPNEVMEALQQYSWPGNIRELENVIERALIHSTGETLTLLDWSPETAAVEAAGGAPPAGATLVSIERTHIQQVLQSCGWKINGLGNAADRLGLHPNTLRFRMKKLGIVRRRLADAGVSRSASAGRAS